MRYSPATSQPGCLTALIRSLFGHTRGPVEPVLPYRLRDDFLSPAERSFYGVLRLAIGSEWVVCPKVGLKDLFYVPGGPGDQSSRNRIAQKHVDFVICIASSMEPQVAIELDDASHSRTNRIERDDLVDAVCGAAGLSLEHFAAHKQYSVEEIRTRLAPHLGTSINTSKPPADSLRNGPRSETSTPQGNPICPKCGVPMILRTGTKGQYAGRQFYGCPNYPNCRQIINLPAGQ